MLVLSLILGFEVTVIFAQQNTDVVLRFGNTMQQWCNTDEIEFLEQIEKMVVGKKKCLVDDKITQDAIATDSTQLLSNGTLEMSTYLNLFAIPIAQGLDYEMTNVKARPDFVEPTAFKDEMPPGFVSADLALKGSMVYNITDLFYVRDGKITKIIDYSSDISLGRALELYSKRKYDEAFRMFRKLAYADFCNFDAQYYMVVMELKKQGCNFLDKKIRDKEIVWFIIKNFLAQNEEAIKLAIKFPPDETKMDYLHLGIQATYEWMLRCKQPISSGLMMSFDEKSKTCGFTNESGEIVIPYGQYSTAFPFHEGRSLVVSLVTGKSGFIDERGNEVVPMIYQNAMCDFYKGRTYCVKDGMAYLVDNQGKVLKTIQDHPNLVTYIPVGKYAFLFKDGHVFDIYDFNGNLCYADYTSWNFNSTTGFVSAYKAGAEEVRYKVAW